MAVAEQVIRRCRFPSANLRLADAKIDREGKQEKLRDALRMNVNAETNAWADELEREQIRLPEAIDPDCPACDAIRRRRGVNDLEHG